MKDRIKSFFVENDLKVLLGWLGINYKKAMKNRIKNFINTFRIISKIINI